MIQAAILVWLSISVGPWWLGLVIFFAGITLNVILTQHRALVARNTAKAE